MNIEIYIFFIIIIIANGVIFFILTTSNKSLEKKVDMAFLSQSEDFFKKIDFLFNRMNQHKDMIHQQTIETINPVSKILDSLKSRLEDMEKSRVVRDSTLQNNLSNLSKHNDDLLRATEQLNLQTNKMINAFKTPAIRGQWSEVQLKRLVEICGMVPHCEFSTQHTLGANRPDMIINLPNNGVIYVDSKNPMDSYLKYLEDNDLAKFKKENLKAFKGHISQLSNKEYWKSERKETPLTQEMFEQSENQSLALDGQAIITKEQNREYISPELVIMFIPLEILWLQALEEDGSILEFASERNVIVATPMTMIALLKTLNFGWSQLKITKSTEKIKQTLFAMIEAVHMLGKATDEIQKVQQENDRRIRKLSDMINKLITIIPSDFTNRLG